MASRSVVATLRIKGGGLAKGRPETRTKVAPLHPLIEPLLVLSILARIPTKCKETGLMTTD
jgi:hypothetical protein